MVIESAALQAEPTCDPRPCETACDKSPRASDRDRLYRDDRCGMCSFVVSTFAASRREAFVRRKPRELKLGRALAIEERLASAIGEREQAVSFSPEDDAGRADLEAAPSR
jgi:hypothetical protein